METTPSDIKVVAELLAYILGCSSLLLGALLMIQIDHDKTPNHFYVILFLLIGIILLK